MILKFAKTSGKKKLLKRNQGKQDNHGQSSKDENGSNFK